MGAKGADLAWGKCDRGRRGIWEGLGRKRASTERVAIDGWRTVHGGGRRTVAVERRLVVWGKAILVLALNIIMERCRTRKRIEWVL